MPRELAAGILYVSKAFGTAAHLCACGCGTKIRTPLGPTAWSVKEHRRGPTLRPSVGNWQEPCQSHYLITNGEVIWARRWTPEEILAGRSDEQARACAYHDRRNRQLTSQVWHWITQSFARITTKKKNGT